MKGYQKLIKYIAIAFAALIIFSIVSGVIGGIGFLAGFFGSDNNTLGKLKEVGVNDNYRVLDIEVEGVNILIKESNVLKVETDSEDVRVKEVGDKLLITEDNNNWFNKNSGAELVIYIPRNYVFDEVTLENGAGRVDVESLEARELELDLGAGKVTLNDLEVSSEASIDGGAGEVIIEDGIINNLELDMGVGRVELNVKLTGTSEINAGVGEIDLRLLDSVENYLINVNKGIGKVMVADTEMTDGSYYGDGSSVVNIDGGIGTINVSFNE